MLLQMVVALMPVFTFQLWFEHSKSVRFAPVFISLLCGGSLLLSIVAYSDLHGFDIDFRFIPLLVGAMYGGETVFFAVSIVYICYQSLNIQGVWDWVELGLFLFLFLPVIYVSMKAFGQSIGKRKQGIAFLLTAMSLLIVCSSLLSYIFTTKTELTQADYYNLGLHGLLCFVTMWLSIIFCENYIERQALSYQLQNLSHHYRIEVQKLQQFIEETPLCVIFVNQAGIITHINEMAIHILHHKIGGKGRKDLIGQPFRSINENIDKDVIGRLLLQALSGNQTTTEFVQEQGRVLLHTSFCVRDLLNNNITGAAIISHDITELNRLRDEVGRMERLSLVGQMAASITHEIRNPMAVIRGFVQLMRERSPDHQQEYFQIVMDELDRANSIINDFLSLAQNRVIAKESCSLHEIINEILPLLWADANLRGQSIELEFADQLPTLFLNEKEMKQLILNLARNGMEAMDQHGILTLQTLVYSDRVELRVIDNGCGISIEKQEHLFEPFYTTKSSGTGLGLPLCLSIVERHGGEIKVESTEGKGTAFIVKFTEYQRSLHLVAAGVSDRSVNDA